MKKSKIYFLISLFIGLILLANVSCSSRQRQLAFVSAVVASPPPPPPPVNLSQRLVLPPSLVTIPEPKFDPIEAVTEQAEAAFSRGEKDYQAGHLERAKQEFDRALTAILLAPISPHENKKLQKTFDTLVDRIHAYELGALQQGDGFAEPTYEPAPLDELQLLTFPEDSPWNQQLQAEAASTVSDLPLVVNSQVASFINFFSSTKKGRATIEATTQRSGRFREMMLRVLQEEGVPLDLLYLAQAESGFQPRARSRAGALGLWQFMPFRGKEYGLERNWWQDERMNPEKATRAAARHLRDLYEMFGDWYLAMAAYNAGPNAVQRAVKRVGTDDFWKLSAKRALPRETRTYVPIILALTIIGKNPDKYQLDPSLPEQPWVYDTVTVDHPIDLRLASEVVGTSVETIQELNPSLLRMTTPNVPEYTLRIPLATKDLFLKRIAMIPPEKRVYWRWYTVRHGETLTGIAQQFKTSVEAIAEVNNLDPKEKLQEAAELVIPVARLGNAGAQLAEGPGVHRVHSGETLSTIARQYGVSVNQLMAWNNLDSTVIRAGSTLAVGNRTEIAIPEGGRYRVRPGDTLAKIARQFGVSVNQLMSWNNLTSAIIHAGNTLVVGGDSLARQQERAVAAPLSQSRTRPSSTVAAKTVSPSKKATALIHSVRRGESLWQIATNYRTTVEAIRQSNGHLGKVLKVGDRVTIPVAAK
ncbi:MAG: LysM peptidoglycan-binding domain-containing protein [Acidobacteria bacterium]|nr:LysM peptidoglycan-binding domain-containing protein [Acidobacteriota bacterium]